LQTRRGCVFISVKVNPMRVSRRRILLLAALTLTAPPLAWAQSSKKKNPPAKKSSRSRRTASRAAAKKPASQPAAPPPKWPDESIQTVAEAVARLREVPAKNLAAADLARRAALEFSLAVGGADGTRATEWVEAVGYQMLPREGPLPEQPDRPILPEPLRTQVQARPATDVGAAELRTFELVDRESARTALPDIARWMLPNDMLAWIDPDPRIAHWVSRREFLVIRMRGRRATIAGGSLLAD
jgi:hypothetical protein